MFIFRITGAVFSLIHCVLFTAGEEVVKLQELEGTTVTLHTGLTGVQSDAHILWFYRSEKSDIKIVNSLNEKVNTDYFTDRFRHRLQLIRSSGSLTIRNISREDSGVYTFHIITGSVSVWRFSVKVYAPVSKPVIRTQAKSRSALPRGSCSPVCSVENGEDVSLSWYEDKERISSISRADSSDSSLHLLLNRTLPSNYTYTCVSDNPLSNQSTHLNITQLCPFNDDKCPDGCVRIPTAALISVGLLGAALILISLIWFWKRSKKQPVSEVEVNYAEVKTGPQKSEHTSKNSIEVNRTRVQDQDSSVVYSDIMI